MAKNAMPVCTYRVHQPTDYLSARVMLQIESSRSMGLALDGKNGQKNVKNRDEMMHAHLSLRPDHFYPQKTDRASRIWGGNRHGLGERTGL